MSKTKVYRHRRQTNTKYMECECGKRAFSSRSAAKRALSKAGNKVRLYICPQSGKWHVTSSNKEQDE